MGKEAKRVRCPWCSEETVATGAKVERYKNNYGSVVERRCPNCGQVLSAYLEEEGDFLSKIRIFPNP